MPSNCVFVLNKGNATYFSGETISGTIILTTTSDKNVRDVSIIFLGEGKVCWSESRSTGTGRNRSSHTTHYRSHETYVDNSTNVHGEGVLPAGTYNFTFNIPLPWECPTSLEGSYGQIRYEISLKINRYYRFDNIYKKPVTIIKSVDLNANPAYKLPIMVEETSRSCCWPCSRGRILFNLRVPFSAYTSGQTVNFTLQMFNQSMDDIEGYEIEFCKKMTFTAKTPHHKERHAQKVLLSKKNTDTCLRLCNRVLEGDFVIPATPPTNERSSVIYVEYFLKVIIQLPCCTPNPDLKVPLVIGTIPIRRNLAVNQILDNDDRQPFLPSAPELSTPQSESIDTNMPPKYDEIMPPSFEEATTRSNSPFIDAEIDERNRIIGFRPLYPVYNMSNPENK